MTLSSLSLNVNPEPDGSEENWSGRKPKLSRCNFYITNHVGHIAASSDAKGPTLDDIPLFDPSNYVTKTHM